MDSELKAKLDKLGEIDEQLRELPKKIQVGSDAEKAAAKAEARKLLGQLFDAKFELETAMLAKMEKHVAELKSKLAHKKSSREKMIESRLSRMTGESEDW